jgi:hypothetical protein
MVNTALRRDRLADISLSSTNVRFTPAKADIELYDLNVRFVPQKRTSRLFRRHAIVG